MISARSYMNFQIRGASWCTIRLILEYVVEYSRQGGSQRALYDPVPKELYFNWWLFCVLEKSPIRETEKSFVLCGPIWLLCVSLSPCLSVFLSLCLCFFLLQSLILSPSLSLSFSFYLSLSSQLPLPYLLIKKQAWKIWKRLWSQILCLESKN